MHRLSGTNGTEDTKNSSIREIKTYTKFKNEHEKLKKVSANKKSTRSISKQTRDLLITRNKLKFSDHVKLNDLWNSYMENQLSNSKIENDDLVSAFESHHPSYEQLSATFSKSDFHGAMVEVLRSKNPSVLKLKGIVIKETQNVFTILSEDNISRTIPKKNCVFRFHWKNVHFDVLGNNLRMKSAMRTTRKIKSISTLNF